MTWRVILPYLPLVKKYLPLTITLPLANISFSDKRNALRGASDDDGEPNTYDYDDSFLTKEGSEVDASTSSDNPTDEDSDWSPEEENVRSLIKEAKGFIRNQKMQRPARNK